MKKTKSKSRWKPGVVALVMWIVFTILVLSLIGMSNYIWYKSRDIINPFPIGSLASVILAWLVATYFQWILPRFSVTTGTTEENISLHDVDHFRDIYFNDIIEPSGKDLICIVIDNLDRVGAADALLIMRTVKTFIVDARDDLHIHDKAKINVEEQTLKKVVFLIPCSDQELKNHIRLTREIKEPDEFLRKFFNLSFKIPKWPTEDAFAFAGNLLDETRLKMNSDQKDRICHIIRSLFGQNPRKPKIFINNLLTRYIVGEECEAANKLKQDIVTNHPDWLAFYLALDEEFPDFEVPSTLEELRNKTWNTNISSDKHSEFLREHSNFISEIDPQAWASYYHLKRPKPYDVIPGFAELVDEALSMNDEFTEKLSEVRKKHPNIVRHIWDRVRDKPGRLNIMASLLNAVSKNDEISIPAKVADDMACLLQFSLYDIKPMPADTTYAKILKARQENLAITIEDVGKQIENRPPYTDERIKFQVDLLKIVLEDNKAVVRLKQKLISAIEHLLKLTREIIPIAIDHPESPTPRIMEEALKVFSGKADTLSAQKLVRYSCELPEDREKYLVETAKAFNNAFQQGLSDSEIKEITIAFRGLGEFIHTEKVETGTSALSQTVSELDRLYTGLDAPTKLELLKTISVFITFESFPQVSGPSQKVFIGQGSKFLANEDEAHVMSFLESEAEKVEKYLSEKLPHTANISPYLCYQVLNLYGEERSNVIKYVWANHNEWIIDWAKNNASKLRGTEKADVQDTILRISESSNYPIGAYEAVKYIKVGNDKSAMQRRESHFQGMIDKLDLSVHDSLKFVLKRMDIANYKPTREQYDKLESEGVKRIPWKSMDNELQGLIQRVIRD
ncbi:MAG: hypothetical protein KAV87_37525 [Desulfobacteraceae bacterium]|nr:hypothetical protein [Desulfobacteraceae bacterium]